MAIKLNLQEDIYTPLQKANSINTLNFILQPNKNFVQTLYVYNKNNPVNFTGKQLYLDILPYYYGGSIIPITLNAGANDGKVIMIFGSAILSALDMSECDCREFIIRAGASELVAYGKITIETYDSYTPPTPSPVTPTNYFVHSVGSGAQFNITLTDGITYRTVSVLDSNGLDITSGVSITLATNLITVNLVTDFDCVVVYSI